MTSQPVSIKFRLNCSQTRLGEIVKVTGSGPELGNWNPANALTMYTSDNEFPIWRAGIIIDRSMQPDPENIEYKYIILQNQNFNDKEFIPKKVSAYWEHCAGNRTMSLTQMGEIQILDVFNEKKLLKLEAHQQDMRLSYFGENGVSSFRQGKNDIKFDLSQDVKRAQMAFENISLPDHREIKTSQ